MTKQVKIIDLFSGPGGLSEGFSALKDPNGNSPFKIAISIEKEKAPIERLSCVHFSGNLVMLCLVNIMNS